jgi:chemotaxis protein histidine kinase CheA
MSSLDDILAGLRVDFLAELPERLDALRAALREMRASTDPRARAHAEHLAHTLSGTAGSYRVWVVASLAGRIEDAILTLDREDPAWQGLLGELDARRAAPAE